MFLHVRDFAEKRKTPEVGDKVRFIMGSDAYGRPCAVDAVHLGNGGQITIGQLLVLGALLVLPILAGIRLDRLLMDWIPVGMFPAYAATISLITSGYYAQDKSQARKKAWRVSENFLHLLELIGGWPGAFLAQRWFRHKVSKGPFQFKFWAIVLLYQLLALDFF